MKMKLLPNIVFLMAAFLAIPASVSARNPEKYFDQASHLNRGLRLAVFRPSVGAIKSVAAIKKNAYLEIPDFEVIGVYHEKEATDYEESRTYVKNNGLEWFHFHAVAADVGEDSLFKVNAWTPEYHKIFQGSDGIIFTGGPDIPPSLFKEKTSLLTVIEDRFRHLFEISAVFHLLGGFQDETFPALLEKRPDFPVLGICLGCQTLNVGTGGTLIQDIPSEIYGKTNVEDVIALGIQFWHNNPYSRLDPQDDLIGFNFHGLHLSAEGKFCSDLDFPAGDQPLVLSSHHQALDKLGKGLRVIATSLDGKIIEAVEHEKYPHILGIQFHPESPNLWDKEARFRQKPGDKPFSLKDRLEEAPPSFDFNKKIWTWFGRALKRSRASRPQVAVSPQPECR